MRTTRRATPSTLTYSLKRLKVLRGYAAHARFNVEIDETPIGSIPRVKDIPSPYTFSPTDIVWTWKGTRIIIRETRHRCYEVFEIPASMTLDPVDN